jgi:predicted NUDIX family phosphoesterase
MSSNIDERIQNLETHVAQIAGLLQYAPRPFVIEFAGTPKSGKSTSVEAIRHFFARHGCRVHILAERAALCPIPMKGHLFFNTWCACSMLAELLANVEAETDIILIDRGVFDALVWLTLQEQRGELTDTEARTIEQFLLLDRWRSLIDLAVVMSVPAEDAMARENSQRITSKGGSIMNPEVLTALAASVALAVESYGSRFSAVLSHETRGESIKEASIGLAEDILVHFENFLNPDILVVPKRDVESLGIRSGGVFGRDAIDRALKMIASKGVYMKRADAEGRNEVVQVVACGVLKNEGKVFLFERKEADPKYQLHGKTTIWQGCHVTSREGDILDVLKNNLADRLSRLLFLSRVFPIQPVGICWDPEEPRSSAHLGVIFEVDINNIHTAADLKKKEFRKGRGHGLRGQFVGGEELRAQQDEMSLESWSRAILANREQK